MFIHTGNGARHKNTGDMEIVILALILLTHVAAQYFREKQVTST